MMLGFLASCGGTSPHPSDVVDMTGSTEVKRNVEIPYAPVESRESAVYPDEITDSETQGVLSSGLPGDDIENVDITLDESVSF